MDHIRITLLASALLLLSGCATMSENECVLADWRTIGYEDGARGAPAEALSSRREACADHGVTPDLDAYLSGRSRGLEEYCRPERGFALGSSGGSYAGVCPESLEAAFLDAYRSGNRLNALRTALTAAEQRVESLERELDNLRSQRRDLEAELIAADTTTERRALALAELREGELRSSEIRADIEQALAEVSWRREDLDDYQSLISRRGY